MINNLGMRDPCFPVYVFEDDRHVALGLTSFINWNRYHLEIKEHEDGISGFVSDFSYFQGVCICDISVFEDAGPPVIDYFHKRPHSLLLIILVDEENLESISLSLRVKADCVTTKPVNLDKIARFLESASDRFESADEEDAGFPGAGNDGEDFFSPITHLSDEVPTVLDGILSRTIFPAEHLEHSVLMYLHMGLQCNTQMVLGLQRLAHDHFLQTYYCFWFSWKDKTPFLLLIPRENGSPGSSIPSADLCNNSGEAEGTLVRGCSELIESSSAILGISLTISISDPGNCSSGFPGMLEQCLGRIDSMFFHGEESVYTEILGGESFEFHLDPGLHRNFLAALRDGKLEKVFPLFEKIIDYPEDTSSEALRNRLILLGTEVISLVESILQKETGELSSRMPDSLHFLREMFSTPTYEKLISLFRQLIELSVECLRQFHYTNSFHIVSSAKKYIDENYREPISLQNVADHVFVSSNYLSRIYKQITGENFNEYLISYRLDMAKRLLVETRYKTYEIADKVGIFDPNYFSRIFKQKVRMSPSEFRERNTY